MPLSRPDRTTLIRDALRLLGIRRLVLAIHDQSFPSRADEEIGRGSPYGYGAQDFLTFARDLGFNGIQLGPQGKTTRVNPSPYDGAIFVRNPLSLAPSIPATHPRFEKICPPEALESIIHTARGVSRLRVQYDTAWKCTDLLIDTVHRRLSQLRGTVSVLTGDFQRFLSDVSNTGIDWFTRAAVYEALTTSVGSDDWQTWSSLDRRLYTPAHPQEAKQAQARIGQILAEHTAIVERFALEQFLCREHHAVLREFCQGLGLVLLGDMQIGFSHHDRWAWGEHFLPGYSLGAPPSRSNPEGQPWGYPLLDPRAFFVHQSDGRRLPGPALRLVAARVRKLLTEYDGVRIDHPHGLVYPWVYRSDDPDPLHAVQNGARLYAAAGQDDHPLPASMAIVDRRQLADDPAYPRYGDHYVNEITPFQVDRFAVVLDIILQEAAAHGRSRDDILCEVLSTWPTPLKAVMQARGLGRFCITQKSDPHDPADIYRSENTAPNDWIMVGSHDTHPLWRIVEERDERWRQDRATILARRLYPEASDTEECARALASDTAAFCNAMFSELFLGPAQNVSVFFTDLLGMREVYNTPGTVGDHNWSLRVPPDYRSLYEQRCERGEAFCVARALSTALRAKARESTEGDAVELSRALGEDRR